MTAPPAALLKTTMRPSTVRYQVLAALCLASTIAYIDRGCIQVVVDPIRTDLQISEQEMGVVMSAFFAAYTIFQLPAGWLAHLWGGRRGLPIFAASWSLMTALCAVAFGFPGLLLARFGMGAAEAGIFPCATASLGRWFPPTRRAWACGILGSFMGVGGALGALLTSWLLTMVNWRWVFALYAVPGLVWAGWFFWWYRDRPGDHRSVNRAENHLIQGVAAWDDPATLETAPPTAWRAIFSHRGMWILNAQQFFRAAGGVFFITWFPTYLSRTFGIDPIFAGTLASLPHFALVLGSPAGGLITDWLPERIGPRGPARQAVAIASLVLCALLIGGASAMPSAILASMVISLGAFASGLAGPAAYATSIDLGGQQVAPVFSVMNMAGNIGAVAVPALVPFLVGWTGGWGAVLFLVAGLHLGAAGCWLFLGPCQPIVTDIAKDGIHDTL